MIILYENLYSAFLTLFHCDRDFHIFLEWCEHHVTLNHVSLSLRGTSPMNHIGRSYLLVQSDKFAFWLACKAFSMHFSTCWAGPWGVPPGVPFVTSFLAHLTHSCLSVVRPSSGWFHFASCAAHWSQLSDLVTIQPRCLASSPCVRHTA